MRLPMHLRVGALLRRAAAQGGNAAVIARGDADGGGLVVLCRERGALCAILEGATDSDGDYRLRPSRSVDGDESPLDDWIAGRRRRDPDLWVVELDIAAAERFAAETIAPN